MSSILEALKKLEQERRGQEASGARAQVLDPGHSPTRRRAPLFTLMAAAALGIAVGASFALWNRAPRPEQVHPAALDQTASRQLAPPASGAQRPLEPPKPDRPATRDNRTAASAKERARLAAKTNRRLEEARGRAHAAPAAEAPAVSEPRLLPAKPGQDEKKPEGTAPVPPPRPEAEAVQVAPSSGTGAHKPPATGLSQEKGGEGSVTEQEQARIPAAEEAGGPPEPASEEPEKIVDTGRSPPGVPKVVLGLLQWSPEPSRRFAFISVDGSAYEKLREGEAARGLAITSIGKDSVTFKYESTRFVIRARH